MIEMILKIINAKRRRRRLQNNSRQIGVYAYPEVNPAVDLDQLLATFPKLSVHGPVCRDCGMDDQELDRGLRCPACAALWVNNESVGTNLHALTDKIGGGE